MVAVVAHIPELASDCWRSQDPAVAFYGVIATRTAVRGGAAAFSLIDFASRGVPGLIAEREMSGESGC
jgi:hypothetical protein